MLNHALLAASGLWPKSSLLGANIVRLPGQRAELALTIDDGPDPEITPLVLSMLAQKNIKATFFCIAEKVAQHPELVKDMVLARSEEHTSELKSLMRNSYAVFCLKKKKQKKKKAKIT